MFVFRNEDILFQNQNFKRIIISSCFFFPYIFFHSVFNVMSMQQVYLMFVIYQNFDFVHIQNLKNSFHYSYSKNVLNNKDGI